MTKYGKMRQLASICLLLSVPSTWLAAQTVPAEKADTARIDRLLKQMTLEEKMNLIRGGSEPEAEYQGQAGYLPGVPRLGVPSLRFADGPPGLLTRMPGQAETATMGVAATFSRKDAEQNGIVIGREARALGIDVVLQPFINIDRDITFARGYNTFGEDPMLSGQIGAAEVRGAQSQGVLAQAKHYIAYDTDATDVTVDEQTLHEVYLAPFAEAVKAGVSSIMCSYNHINGPYACGNADTLKTMLKGELGFKGFVTSDWGAVHNVDFINQGLDMEMPGQLSADSPMASMVSSYFASASSKPAAPAKMNDAMLAGMLGGSIPEEPVTNRHFDIPPQTDRRTLGDALKDGTVSEATINEAARRVLYEMDRFGYLDGKQKHNVTAQDIDANAAIIEKTAEDAAVLLKNEGGVLPLKTSSLAQTVLIGPTAGQVDAIGTFGERSPGRVERQVGPLGALERLSKVEKIEYAVDDDMTGTPIPADLFSHDGKPGLLRVDGSKTVVDAALDFTRTNGKALQPNSEPTWKGEISIPSDGDYWFYLQALGTRASLHIDGKEVGRTGASKGAVHGDIQYPTQDNALPTADGLDNVRRAVQLKKGKHAIEVKLSSDTSSAPVQARLNWVTPEQRHANHQAAIDAAKHAKTAVVFLWTRGKPDFVLPGEQDQLVEDIAAVNPNTIVVLNTSQPIAMPWLPKVKAVLEMWWPGDEGGWSTAKLLLGQGNPAGRLPVSWAKQLTDYASTDPAHPERSAKGVAGKTTFSEGVLLGYRWFDSQKIEPLFPFGYGLSYTHFELSVMQVSRSQDGGATVSVHVKNTGSVTGDEVPQVYLDAPAQRASGVQFAPRTLVGFDRITLNAGEAKEITLQIPPRAFQYWSAQSKAWITPPGSRVLHVGNSSANLQLQAELK